MTDQSTAGSDGDSRVIGSLRDLIAQGYGPEDLVEVQRVPSAVLDVEGTFLAVNSLGYEVIGVDPPVLAGRSLGEFFPRDFAAERTARIRSVIHAGRAVADFGRLRGLLGFTTYVPIDRESALVVFSDRHPLAVSPRGFDSIHVELTNHADPGPLADLTERELHILKLLGEGLSADAIARRLCRSKRTIQWYRVQLGRKLNATNRVELARLAVAAGLPAVALEDVVRSIHSTGGGIGWCLGLPHISAVVPPEIEGN